MDHRWPLSKELLLEILADHISDEFVCRLIWERLGYQKKAGSQNNFSAGLGTPEYWSSKFPEAPPLISKRSAAVHLTRSIPKEYKQSLKKYLNFQGYLIGELFPRRTRRATAVNWLLAWTFSLEEDLPKSGPLPSLLEEPSNPLLGHPGDPEIQ